MKKLWTGLLFLLFTCTIMLLSIAGPQKLTSLRDREMFEKVHSVTAEAEGEGYRYTLSPGEKLYILSQGLNGQKPSESDQYALTRGEFQQQGYGEQLGNYAFVVNLKGPSGQEITDEQIYDTCNSQLDQLKELGILPGTVRKVESGDYDAALYSAIDVLEPRNNVAVWKLSLSNSRRNTDRGNRVIDVYIDADSGKLYEFYVRSARLWTDIDPDEVVKRWGAYIGLGEALPYEAGNPLMEATPDFKKYIFAGNGGEKTIVTLGFYEGINELFLKVSR